MEAAFVRRVGGIFVLCDDKHHCDIPPPSTLVDGGDRYAVINIILTRHLTQNPLGKRWGRNSDDRYARTHGDTLNHKLEALSPQP